MKKSLLLGIICLSLTIAVALSIPFTVNSIAQNTDYSDAELEIVSKNLSYNSEVYVMFAVEAKGVSLDNVEMLFWSSRPDAVTDTPKFVDTSYEAATKPDGTVIFDCVFSSYGVAAKDFPDEIYCAAHVKNSDVYSEIARYSVLEYLFERLTSEGITETQTNMYNAAITYGECAQQLLEHSTSLSPLNMTYVAVEGGTLSDGFSRGVYSYSDELTVIADDPATFSAWADEGGEIVSYDPEYSFAVGDKHVKLFAVSGYSIIVEGGSILSENTVFNYGDVVEITAPLNKVVDGSALYFDNWTNSEGAVVSTLATSSHVVVSDETYIANYKTVDALASASQNTMDSSSNLPVLSGSLASTNAISDGNDVTNRINGFDGSDMDGYVLEYVSYRDSAGSPTYLNSFFDTSVTALKKSLSLDIHIPTRDLEYNGDGFGDGKLNEAKNDFFTANGQTLLYNVYVTAGKNKIIQLGIIASINDSAIVDGYYVAYRDETGEYVNLSEDKLSLDKKYNLALEISIDTSTAAPALCNYYLNGAYITSIIPSINAYHAEDKACLAISTSQYTKGSVYIDNITYIESEQ